MMSNHARDNQGTKTSFQHSRSLFAPKIIEEAEIKRPAGYALPGFVALSVTAEADGFKATGYGEGPRELAREKAISEAFERLALFKFCADTQSTETSSGWAAHRSAELATRAAVFELIERHVALSAWESGGPFYLVPETLWPKFLLLWKAEPRPHLEFPKLRVLMGSNNGGACISVLLLNDRGNFVAGHASAFRLDDAILSAANECFRAAHAALKFEHLKDVIALHAAEPGAISTPGAHFLAYAYKETIPDVVKIEVATAEDALTRWGQHQVTLNNLNLADFDSRLFVVDDRVVARVKAPRFRQIFWGRTSDLSKRNQFPHFVG